MSSKFSIETVEKEKVINFLTNVDPEFVSLVRHGANRTPFRVIKSEEGIHEMMFVQSILVPRNVDINSISEKEGLGWLKSATLNDKEEFDEYVKYHQIKVSKFDGKLSMTKVDPSGVYAITGKLVNKEDESNAITVKDESVSKMMNIEQSAAETPVAEVERKPYVISFKEMFDVELDNFLSVVRGTLSQTGIAPDKRKKTVMTALDGFRNFLTIALDTVSDNSKSDSSEFAKLSEKLETIHSVIVNGGSKDMTKEEVKAIVIETLAEKANEVTASKQEEKREGVTSPNASSTETASKQLEDTIKSLSESVNGIVSKMDELSKAQKELGNQIVTVPAASHEDTPPKPVGDKPTSVFSGLITGRRRQLSI